MQIIVLLIVLSAFIWFFASFKKRKSIPVPVTVEDRNIMEQYVPFYNQLDQKKKQLFEKRVQQFLAHVRITGVKTTVEPMDRIFIAASAIIPIFNFQDWEYTNLNEVLLYPDNFNEQFHQEGQERDILGMVGWGAMQNVMIISKHELRQGFLNASGKGNTAIHEFVHLIDKTDGATDGVPENIIKQQYILPWLSLMHRSIQEIQKGKSDINPYGATNEAEFFAVVSEYFFERPDLLKQKHPELFGLLEEIYLSKPVR